MAVFKNAPPNTDAINFFSVANITDTTQCVAVANLVTDLKNYNLWDKMVTLYPFVGGTANSHKYNLKNVATYALTFTGGLTHSQNGIQPTVSPAGIATASIAGHPATAGNMHLSFYTNQTTTVTDFPMDIGLSSVTGMSANRNGNNYKVFYYADQGLVQATTSPISGFHVMSRISTTSLVYYKDGTSRASSNASITSDPESTLTLGAPTPPGASFNLSGRAQQFASMGLGLTATDNLNLYTAVQRFQTTLGRQV